ncbi:MAG: YheU family protein [Gammaproteobacteria bacterium]|nr:YheU family protein [Gammaproteobacteria bacterium]
MLIPYQELSTEALRGLISQFLLAEASDDLAQVDCDHHAAQVMAALKRGELVISYSEENESAAIRYRDTLAFS